MKNFLYKWIIIILSSPLIAFHMCIHVYENIQLQHNKFADKLFLKRFNLLDQQHVDDFLLWNDEYIENREE